MEFLGYIAAILIGIALGLVGAGGSILTIPVLVYLMCIPPVNATSYSLFIVGMSAIFASYTYFKNNLISFKTVIVFGVPSVISIFFTRKFVLHAIPETIFKVGNIIVTKDVFLMVLLSILMLSAAYLMIRRPKSVKVEMDEENKEYRTFLIFQQGIIVGFIVGLVGAGGGFIIIPVLVLLAKLPMKKAVGTALVIIMLNSWIGFFSDFNQHIFDWKFLFFFTFLVTCGIFAGGYISKFISGSKLKPIFGWFVLVVGSFILIKELFSNHI